MYYIYYLESLCKRRRWPDPHYECYQYNGGYTCRVRVNHRDYYRDMPLATPDLAKEEAAQYAYLKCYHSAQEPISSYQGQGTGNGASAQPPRSQNLPPVGSVSMAMAQPRYVPPAGGVQNVLPKPEQAPISSNGRMANGQGVGIVGHHHSHLGR